LINYASEVLEGFFLEDKLLKELNKQATHKVKVYKNPVKKRISRFFPFVKMTVNNFYIGAKDHE